jgi:iron complex outermembrane receptor protein
LVLENGLHGETYGAELAADAAVAAWWRLNAAYSYLVIDLERDAGSRDTIALRSIEGASPHHQAVLRSLMTLGQFQLDGVLRYVDVLPGQRVDSYVDVDVRVARRLGAAEVSVVGHDLVEGHHREFAGGTEVQRGVYGQVRWWW